MTGLMLPVRSFATPQVILTADRVAYFTNIDATYSAGDTYNGQEVLAAVSIDEYSNVTNQNYFVSKGLTTPVKVIFEPSFSSVRPTSTRYWFRSFVDLTAIEGLENLNTSNVTSMYGMFWGCSGLTSLDVTHFDTSNVTDMYCMFVSCSGLTSLDVSHFDTSNVTNMIEM